MPRKITQKSTQSLAPIVRIHATEPQTTLPPHEQAARRRRTRASLSPRTPRHPRPEPTPAPAPASGPKTVRFPTPF